MKSTRSTPVVQEQIVAFADLGGYHRHVCSKLSPEGMFAFLSEYYSTAQVALGGSDGRIVKFIGDAILMVFPPSDPIRVVTVLRKLKTSIDAFLAQGSFEARFRLKAHLGMVASGKIGVGELERFDVCGLAVNEAALLPDGEWVLSDEFRKRAGE